MANEHLNAGGGVQADGPPSSSSAPTATATKKEARAAQKVFVFNEFPAKTIHGDEFCSNVGLQVQRIPFNFEVVRVQGRVRWKDQGWGEPCARLRLKRVGKKTKELGRLELAYYNRGIMPDEITTLNFTFNPNDDHPFWHTGRKDEGMGVLVYIGDEECTLTIKELTVQVTLKNLDQTVVGDTETKADIDEKEEQRLREEEAEKERLRLQLQRDVQTLRQQHQRLLRRRKQREDGYRGRMIDLMDAKANIVAVRIRNARASPQRNKILQRIHEAHQAVLASDHKITLAEQELGGGDII